ncbi:MAG: hypothetical protein ACRC6D_02490 [Aeromonas sp.]
MHPVASIKPQGSSAMTKQQAAGITILAFNTLAVIVVLLLI